jgi:hypothetical protein
MKKCMMLHPVSLPGICRVLKWHYAARGVYVLTCQLVQLGVIIGSHPNVAQATMDLTVLNITVPEAGNTVK